ncbi:MAG TPA: acyl-CoA dehydrogenase family protein [Polyangiales bacterium]|jgi:alkylation response protein AidB-like acyl-CoA dehydrogenase|nr:acyl-CoA dehydrogenase family protein [Polyangiales bacterium]
MALTLTAEQRLLKDNATQFVRESAPVGQLRKLRDTKDATGFSADLWRQMAELGWAGIVVPEAYGGSGLGYTELGLVLEACGRTLAVTPILSTVVLGSGLLLGGGSEALKRELLPAISDGRGLVAVAFEEAPRFKPYQVACKAERHGAGYRLTGQKTFVLDGHVASRLIVSARTSGNPSDRHGISLFVVDPAQPGVKIERATMLDSRNAARCTFEAVEVADAALLGAVDLGADLLDPVLDRAAVCVSAELLGLISQAYETTLEYLKTRVQFDALIGSFQALQHRAVDMFCEIELAKSLVLDALAAVDEGREDAPLLASAVKARLSDAASFISREAVQLHGGIGMTDEHDIGFYLKRAAVAEASFGDAAYHRDRFARLKGF